MYGFEIKKQTPLTPKGEFLFDEAKSPCFKNETGTLKCISSGFP